jgi:hypothetical protein
LAKDFGVANGRFQRAKTQNRKENPTFQALIEVSALACGKAAFQNIVAEKWRGGVNRIGSLANPFALFAPSRTSREITF